jgi:hypothetical protein
MCLTGTPVGLRLFEISGGKPNGFWDGHVFISGVLDLLGVISQRFRQWFDANSSPQRIIPMPMNTPHNWVLRSPTLYTEFVVVLNMKVKK